MKYRIDNLSQIGIVDDLPNYELPDNAFSDGSNVRFTDGKVIKTKGWQSVFSLPRNATTLTLTGIAPSVSQI